MKNVSEGVAQMLVSLALLLLFGFIGMKLVSLTRLPGLIGLLIVGILFGPYVLGLLDQDLLMISQDLRLFALIIILIRAGLGLHRDQLKAVGGPALRLSVIPCVLEGFTVAIAANFLLGFSFAEAGMLGFILAAVSPAVIVPSMLELEESGYGTDKEIPTLLLAGASVDDVFAITFFGFFLSLGTGVQQNMLLVIAEIPYSIIGGILGGIVFAILLLVVFKWRRFNSRNTEQLLLLLSVAIIYYYIGEGLGFASLLGIMAIGFVILERTPRIANLFSAKLTKIWLFAQIILFTLVGAEVNIEVALEAGLIGFVIILVGLVGRSLGVWLSTIGTSLSLKERLFCMIAYLPKATVQAAIGSLPLAAGVEVGGVILALAVLAILITAPLGAIGIKLSAPHLLTKN
ncbi:cation:proton antiporter [Amphibacillus sp. Q70]|uniref:cation:proton antiporter n=1 Tax=Amphibacillus sp. Q70 TaxID=3453416 RepID=UPI003F876305